MEAGPRPDSKQRGQIRVSGRAPSEVPAAPWEWAVGEDRGPGNWCCMSDRGSKACFLAERKGADKELPKAHSSLFLPESSKHFWTVHYALITRTTAPEGEGLLSPKLKAPHEPCLGDTRKKWGTWGSCLCLDWQSLPGMVAWAGHPVPERPGSGIVAPGVKGRKRAGESGSTSKLG